MEPMTYEQWQRRQLRRRFSTVGWILLVYYLIMNVAVFFAAFAEIIITMMKEFSTGNFGGFPESAVSNVTGGWGYILASVTGLLILLFWKKPRYWKDEIWARGKPMTVGSFFGILCIFLSGQSVYQIMTTSAELLLNTFGLTMMDGLAAMNMGMDRFDMFLYIGILAPITEEILFRGLIQRTLLPYGKKFAIFCSAFVFGLYHGNLLQSPYAFLVGLVLGYTAAEYSVAWAMVLHMINNLVIADMLTRLTAGMSEMAAGVVLYVVIGIFTVAAIVIAIIRRREIGAYLRQERMIGL